MIFSIEKRKWWCTDPWRWLEEIIHKTVVRNSIGLLDKTSDRCGLDFKDSFSRRAVPYFPYSRSFVIQGEFELDLRVFIYCVAPSTNWQCPRKEFIA
jgi:hypothetical protein